MQYRVINETGFDFVKARRCSGRESVAQKIVFWIEHKKDGEIFSIQELTRDLGLTNKQFEKAKSGNKVINDYSSYVTLADGAKVKLAASLADTASADKYKIFSGDSVTVSELKVLTPFINPIVPIEIRSSNPIPVFSNFFAMYTTNLKFLSTNFCLTCKLSSNDNCLISSASSLGAKGGGKV